MKIILILPCFYCNLDNLWLQLRNAWGWRSKPQALNYVISIPLLPALTCAPTNGLHQRYLIAWSEVHCGILRLLQQVQIKVTMLIQRREIKAWPAPSRVGVWSTKCCNLLYIFFLFKYKSLLLSRFLRIWSHEEASWGPVNTLRLNKSSSQISKIDFGTLVIVNYVLPPEFLMQSTVLWTLERIWVFFEVLIFLRLKVFKLLALQPRLLTFLVSRRRSWPLGHKKWTSHWSSFPSPSRGAEKIPPSSSQSKNPNHTDTESPVLLSPHSLLLLVLFWK